MNRAEVIRLLAIISEAWRGFEVTEGKISIWGEMLSDFPPQIVIRALKALMITATFPPAISELRCQIVRILRPQLTLSKAEAWEECRKALWHYGPDREREGMETLSLLSRKVVSSLGWREMCEGPPGTIRAHFFELFEELRDRELENVLVKPALEGWQPPSESVGKELSLSVLLRGQEKEV